MMRTDKNLQVVVGLSAPLVRKYFEQEVNKTRASLSAQETPLPAA